MKKLNLIAALALAVSLFAVPAFAEMVTGTVVSKTNNQIVVTTVNGQETFSVAAESMYPTDLEVGDRVTINYSPDTAMGGNRATSVVIATDATGMTGTTTTGSAYDSRTSTTGSSYDARTGTYDDDNLPGTAGPVPLLTALGTFALVGGLALRKFSKRNS
jgi:hypothetical protein